MSLASTPNGFDQELYQKMVLDLNATPPSLTWDVCILSLVQALQSMDNPATEEFLQSCLQKSVDIFLDQKLAILAPDIREKVEQGIQYALMISLASLERSDYHLRVIAQLFNTKRDYYKVAGDRNGFRVTGTLELRSKLQHHFYTQGGFNHIAAHFKKYKEQNIDIWVKKNEEGLGGAALLSLLTSLYEMLRTKDLQKKIIDQSAIIITEVMTQQLETISEGLVKTDGAEILNDLFGTLRRLLSLVAGENGEKLSFDFWLKLTLFYLKSSNLPLRLVGCENMENLISIAEESLPIVTSYYIQSAGNPDVIGEYKLTRQDRSLGSIWTNKNNETGLVITLFQCGVSNDQKKWWFLSEADSECPGTEKDIDYYKHQDAFQRYKSHPPLSGWRLCAGRGERGRGPVPVLRVSDEITIPPNSFAESVCQQTLLSEVLNNIYGDSMHREVVARSSNLLFFLVKVNSLNNAHIDLIWKACLRCGEAELCDEILHVLASLCMHLKTNFLVHLLDIASELTNNEGGGGMKMGVKDSFRRNSRSLPPSNNNSPSSSSSSTTNTASQGQYSSGSGTGLAMRFANKLATMKFLQSIPQPIEPQLLNALLGLVWGLVSLPSDLWRLNKQSPDDVFDLARDLLRCHCVDDTHHMKALTECLSLLRTSSNITSLSLPAFKSSRTTSAGNAGGSSSKKSSSGRQSPSSSNQSFDEDNLLHTFSLASLVLENFPSPALRRSAVDRLASEHGLIDLLSSEIAAWRTRRSSHFPIGNVQGSVPTISPALSSPLYAISSPSSASDESPRVRNLAGAMSASSIQSTTNTSTTNPTKSTKGTSSPSSSISTLSSELGARLDLWAVVYSASPLVSLGTQQLAELWKLLQLPEEKERCLSFFNSALSFFTAQKDGVDEYDEYSYTCFGEEEISFISSELLSKDTDWTYLGMDAYLCLRGFQNAMTSLACGRSNEINGGARSMDVLTESQSQQFEQPITSHIKAIMNDDNCHDVLWSVFLKCRSDKVASMVQADLIEIYNNFNYIDKIEEMQTRFIARCVQYLQSSVSDLCNLNDNDNHSITRTCDLIAIRLRIVRCLMILKSSLSTSRGPMPLPHVLKSSSNMIKINVKGGRRIEVASTPTQQNRAIDIEPFFIYAHPLETIRSIRLRIRDKVASNYPINGIILLHNYKMLKHDERMVRDECFLNKGLSFTATMNGLPNFSLTTEEDLTPPHKGMKHIGELIARNDDFFNALFNLLNHPKLDDPTQTALTHSLFAITENENNESNYNNDDNHLDFNSLPTSIAIWEFLLTLPTQEKNINIFFKSCDILKQNSDIQDTFKWDQIFGGDNWHQIVYFLQICESFLAPNHENYEDNNIVSEKYCNIFKKAFLLNGGLKQVLDIFMRKNLGAPPTTQTTIINMGSIVALRIIKRCLFGFDNNNHNKIVESSYSFQWKEELGVEILPPLLGRLVMILLSTHHHIERYDSSNEKNETINKCFGVDDLVEVALFTVTLLINTEPNLSLDYFTNSQWTKELIVNLLVLNKKRKVRNSMRSLCLDSFKTFAFEISQWLISQLILLQPDCHTCDELFNVLGSYVRKNIPGLNLANMSQVIVTKLMMICKFTSTNKDSMKDEDEDVFDSTNNMMIEKVEAKSIATMLSGCLILLSDILKLDPQNSLQGTELEFNSVSVLFHEFLFTLPEKAHLENKRPVCATGGALAYRSAFGLLEVLCRNNESDLITLIEELDKLSQVCKTDLTRKWSVECSSDVKAKGMKFAGLWNQGCTCYMNSALQQLFMIEPLRKAIIEATIKYETVINGDKYEAEELIGCDVSIEIVDNSNPDNKTSWHRAKVFGWLELEECHLISYQENNQENSSTLASVPQKFNLLLGRQGIETGRFLVYRDLKKLAPVTPLQSDDALTSACHVLEQMQKTFVHLARNEKRYVDCRALVEACNCMQLEFNVFQQNDAPEFYDKLMHKLEDALKTTDKFADYERCFGMKVVNQSIPKEQTDRFKPREKSDTIMKVELKVQGMDSIEESLDDFVKDEVMDGDNKIEFEDEDKKSEKIAGVRRTCLSQLPNILVLHLKRFDLDYNTFQTVKLNNRCSFPTRLNMKPYTKAGMEARDAELQNNNDEEDEVDPESSSLESPTRRTRQSGSSIPASSPKSADGSSFSSPTLVHQHSNTSSTNKSLQQNDDDVEDDSNDFLYDLRGVLVHSGGSQSGHYYSFSKDSITNEWYKFDDDEVTSWNPDEMEKECFGGKYKIQRPNNKFITRDLTANALMVFYDKVSPNQDIPNNREEKDYVEDDNVQSVASVAMSDSNSESEDNKIIEKNYDNTDKKHVLMSGIEAYEDEVYDANLQFRRLGYIFDHHLHDFLRKILSGVCGLSNNNNLDSDSNPYWPSIIQSMSSINNDNATPSNSNQTITTPITLSSLQIKVVQYCISFFFDIILHSSERERESTNLWVSAITNVFNKHPCSAYYFLDQLVWNESIHESWLKNFILLSPDYFARFAFINLIENAMKVVAPFEEKYLIQEIEQVNMFAENHAKILSQQPSLPLPQQSQYQYPIDDDDDEEEDDDEGDEDESDSFVEITMSSVRDMHGNVIDVSNEKTDSICVDFIRCIIAFLSPKAQAISELNYGSSDEIFLLIQKLVESNDLIRNCFIAHETIAKLVYLLCGRIKSTDLVNKLTQSINKFMIDPNGNGINFMNPYEYHTSFKNVNQGQVKKFRDLTDPIPALEAITALVNIPQVQKLPLLITNNKNKTISNKDQDSDNENDEGISNVFEYNNEEGNSLFHETSLSPELINVLTDQFKENSIMKNHMDINELATYLHDCGKPKHLLTKIRLERILNTHGLLSSNRLTLDGFLDYYKSLSISNPKEVWSHLNHLGYRNDLTHFKDEAVIKEDNSKTSSKTSSHLNLPPVSNNALASWSFFELVGDNIEESLPCIIERVCANNRDTSTQLLNDCLDELCIASSSAWIDKSVSKRSFSVLSTLSKIDDDFSEARLEYMFIKSSKAILTTYNTLHQQHAIEFQKAETAQDHQTYQMAVNRLESNASISSRYSHLVKLLSKEIKIKNYLYKDEIYPLWEQMRIQQVQPINNVQETPPQTIYVDGAGALRVNRIYTQQSGLSDGVPIWGSGEFMIYRCRLQSKEHHWYISQVVNGQPGTSQDIDYYSAPSIHKEAKDKVGFEAAPPKVGWFHLQPHGILPIPELEFADMADYASETTSGPGVHTSDDDSMGSISGLEMSYDN